jgi:hypothetical protein
MAHKPNLCRSLDAPVTDPDFHGVSRRIVRLIGWIIHCDQRPDGCIVIGAVDDVRRHHAAIDVELMNAVSRHHRPPMLQGRGSASVSRSSVPWLRRSPAMLPGAHHARGKSIDSANGSGQYDDANGLIFGRDLPKFHTACAGQIEIKQHEVGLVQPGAHESIDGIRHFHDPRVRSGGDQAAQT